MNMRFVSHLVGLLCVLAGPIHPVSAVELAGALPLVRISADPWKAALSVTSPPVNITVGAVTKVSIKATRSIAEETSSPLKRITLRGEFTVSRDGATNEPQSVYVLYSGTATPGADFPQPPFRVTIPAGAVSTTIDIVPAVDNQPEGIERVVATLSNCPPRTQPPMGIPCVQFDVEPLSESATVFIRDDGITQASIQITQPAEGAQFRSGSVIEVLAEAIDLDGYISRVELWDGETQVGVSELFFFRAPDPGSPIQHRFAWRNAAPGKHELTARSRRADGADIRSFPVHIAVDGTTNQAPVINITKPAPGSRFSPQTPIEMIAEGSDPDGYIHKVEFFVDDRKQGEVSIEFIREPDPGVRQAFDFVWSSPTSGPHVLAVRATDDNGLAVTSSKVDIQVTAPDALPILRVTPRDAFASEPGANAPGSPLDTASFLVWRTGPTNNPLRFTYTLQGAAGNGTDYETLSGESMIPDGHESVTVTIRPLADNRVEGIETVILALDDSRAFIPEYRVGVFRRAAVLISDTALARVSSLASRLADGAIGVSFPAQGMANFRLEVSADLKTWETVCDTLGGDEFVHYVDSDAPKFMRRFYRLTPGIPPPE